MIERHRQQPSDGAGGSWRWPASRRTVPVAPTRPAAGLRPLAAVAMALSLLAAGCGAGDGDDAQPADDEMAYGIAAGNGDDDQADADASESTSTGGETMAPETSEPGSGDDTSATTPTSTGSGLAPVTTIAVAPGGDPDGIYRGVLGKLDPNEPVVAGAVVPPPSRFNVLPLTGLPGTVPNRPAAVVKIDNGTAAAPQTGLNAADIVIEEEVEGGVTRFAAVFHTSASIVGPVRSGRTTDLALVSSLGSPLLLYSGANQITEGILRSQPAIQNRSHDSSSGYWRDRLRRPPSNLYTDTAPHWASAAGGPPPAQFHYRSPADAVPGALDTELTVSYGASAARWRWDGSRWLRWQRGLEHRLASGQQVSAANVVVIEATRVDTGMVDASGGPVPEFVFVGTGRATVFTDGRRIVGTWTRPTLNSVATLTHAPGEPIELTPGRTWVQLVEAGAGQLG